MSDVVLLLSGVGSLLGILMIVLIVMKSRARSQEEDEDDGDTRTRKAGRSPRLPTAISDEVRVGGRRVARQRHPARNQTLDSDEDFDDDADPLGEDIALPLDGKLGVKKRRKLEMKAEKRQARERELEEREERKQRQAEIEERRQAEEAKRQAAEVKEREEEARLKAEKEQKELEEYLAMKESFAVEGEGFEEDADEEKSENKLKAFIDHIKRNKVVLLEDLAGHFKMKTQDVINRVQDLLVTEELVGVIDDRGKFIYITNVELESVAKFIKQRGRVSIAELVDSSNSLVNLQPEAASVS